MVDIYKSSKRTKKEKSSDLKKIRQEVYRLIGKRSNALSSFMAQPKKLKFENQMKKEEIILLLRRHWVTNISWFLLALVMIVIPFFVFSFPVFSFLPAQFQLIIFLMWYLLVTAFILEHFLGWYFNVYLITNERVVDIDFVSLIYKNISDAEIEMIQDVTYNIGGFLKTMFNYGDVFVQTAAEKPQFEFHDVPNPALVVKVLQNLRLEEKQEQIEGRLM